MADSEKEDPSKAPTPGAEEKVEPPAAEEKVEPPPAAEEKVEPAAGPEPGKEPTPSKAPSNVPSKAPSKIPSKNEASPTEAEKPAEPEKPPAMNDDKNTGGEPVALNLVQGRVDSYGQIHYGSEGGDITKPVTKNKSFEKDYWICMGLLFVFMMICIVGTLLLCFLGVQLFPQVNQTEPASWNSSNATTVPSYGQGGNDNTSPSGISGIGTVTFAFGKDNSTVPPPTPDTSNDTSTEGSDGTTEGEVATDASENTTTLGEAEPPAPVPPVGGK